MFILENVEMFICVFIKCRHFYNWKWLEGKYVHCFMFGFETITVESEHVYWFMFWFEKINYFHFSYQMAACPTCAVFHFHLMDVDFSGGMYGMPPLVDRYGLGLPMGHAAMVRKKESLIARICIYDHICKLHSNVSAWVSIVFFFW